VIAALRDMRWTVLLAAMAGFFMAPLGDSWWRHVLDGYDERNPVVRMSGTLVKQDAESVWIEVVGEKLRACRYIRLQPYTRQKSGVLTDAYARRDGVPERGDTKPPGVYSIGTWRVWPRGEAVAVLMYVLHDCDGRVVTTKVAEVDVP
jgi:phosphoribosyl-AMP cyclohydrolase